MFKRDRFGDFLNSLASLEPFRSLRRSELLRVAQLTTLCRFAPGAHLCIEGSLPLEVFVILSGTVAVTTAEGGRLATIGRGEMAGELAALTRSRRTANLTAVTEVQALVMNLREFATLMRDVPKIAAHVGGQSSPAAVRSRVGTVAAATGG
jgi:CRP-like cAMP-binding protein